ncbi:gtpase-activating protein gyp3 [Lichtheimia corymbifera JMRC:FSU:9682]|uniref:Gtpase-activating protein gyp3 n=1 Tax=Lichtheimia corymbifera JMRC:FSU:9682 TaxID=1263082 RepID=A0A068S4T4_9FUNG|nr:gtpase-activating protein gyp3 [Lichtheimia corymbifera JMRC:FSU:9682]
MATQQQSNCVVEESSLLKQHQQSLRRAFENLSVSNNNPQLKRQQSDHRLSAGASFSSSTTTNNNAQQSTKRKYLTVCPPPLTLKPSMSSPTATSPRTPAACSPRGYFSNSPIASPRTPRLVSPQERPYSPYCSSAMNVSTSSLASTLSSASSAQQSTSEGYSTSSLEDDDLSLPSTPPAATTTSPCWPPSKLDEHEIEREPKPVERRDAYGFKQPTQWVKLAEQLEFEQTSRSMAPRQLKIYVRKGIPHDLRGKAWMHYSGAKAKMETNAGLYQSLVRTAEAMGEHNEYAEIINRDLHRTFPDNDQFACAVTAEDGSVSMVPETNAKLRALRRVLLAFSMYAPHIGYCQSLNYLAGFFLLFVHDEESAFWMLITTVHDYFPENMYDVTMEGAHIDQTVLMMMVYERLPGVWNKIGSGKCFWECVESDGLPSITLVTSHWFLTQFINILPVETVLRVWDALYIEGSKVLFRVALTIIKMNERRIWALDDPIEIFPILQNMPRRLVDCHAFMDAVFAKDSVGADLTTAEIERRRVLFRDRRKQQRAAAAAAAASNSPSSQPSMSSPVSSSTTSSFSSFKNLYFGRR